MLIQCYCYCTKIVWLLRLKLTIVQYPEAAFTWDDLQVSLVFLSCTSGCAIH